MSIYPLLQTKAWTALFILLTELTTIKIIIFIQILCHEWNIFYFFIKPSSVSGLHAVKIVRLFTLWCGWNIQGADIFAALLSCNFFPGKSRRKVIKRQTHRCDSVIKNKIWCHFLNCLVSKAGHKYGKLKPHLQSLKLQKSPTVRNSVPPVSKHVNIIVDFTWYMQ